MWILRLNDMRFVQIEMTAPVARAETADELKAFLAREEVASYRDGQWVKTFRKDGPLEWFNPPGFEAGIFDVGTDRDAAQRWREAVEAIPYVPGLSEREGESK